MLQTKRKKGKPRKMPKYILYKKAANYKLRKKTRLLFRGGKITYNWKFSTVIINSDCISVKNGLFGLSYQIAYNLFQTPKKDSFRCGLKFLQLRVSRMPCGLLVES